VSDKTESYIILKPIAERFTKVAAEITDDEIKSIIKSSMYVQLKSIHFGYMLGEIIDEWIDNNTQLIENLLLDSYKSKLS
jgi:hypothetical protein